MLSNAKYIFYVLALITSICYSEKSITIKVFHVFESFGTETQELKNSIIINFDSNGFMIDSTIFSHTLPLSKKYVYVSGPNEGLKLKRKYDKEMVLSYKFEYDKLGNRISTTLLGTNDSLYWKEYQKYDDSGNPIKKIRYNPLRAVNPDMMNKKEDAGEMIWGESYEYDSTGTVLELREFYNNYVLVVSTYDLDKYKKPTKREEYFDPSVILQTIYFHNNDNQLSHEVSVGRLGRSFGSKRYEYDILGRRINTVVYNQNGAIEEKFNTVFDDDNFKIYDYYSDSLSNLRTLREILLNNEGRMYIEAVLDEKERVLEKNVYYYDNKGRVAEVRQYDMVRRGRTGDREIPIRVNTYEYQ